MNKGNNSPKNDEYDMLIHMIRKRRKLVLAVTIVLLLVTLFFIPPFEFQILEETVFYFAGIGPVVGILLMLCEYFAGMVAYAWVSAPFFGALDTECDPGKHLSLNAGLGNRKNQNSVCATDYLYLGCFDTALSYANKMVESPHATQRVAGLFTKARCEFFLGDQPSFRQTVQAFDAAIENGEKVKPKTKAIYEKYRKVLYLLLAIADGDREKTDAGRKTIEAWGNSKATQGFIHYLKGLAAYHTDDKFECIYHLMYVKENCPKTGFAALADEYLARLS